MSLKPWKRQNFRQPSSMSKLRWATLCPPCRLHTAAKTLVTCSISVALDARESQIWAYKLDSFVAKRLLYILIGDKLAASCIRG